MKLLSSAWLSLSALALAAPLKVSGLKTEFEADPVGVAKKPRLSWLLESDERGKRQTGYEILAASSQEKLGQNDGDLWQTKKEKDFRSHLIQWDGQALQDGQKVFWKVRVTDEKGEQSVWSVPASFTVGEKRTLQPIESTSSFQSSNARLNALFQTHKSVLRSRLSKYVKGEPGALGHGIDVQQAAREYLYHFGAGAVLTHWLDAVDQGLSPSGYFPISPQHSLFGAGHSDAGITVAHPLWWMTGDAATVARRWKTMDNYMVAREREDQTFRGRNWGLVPYDAGHLEDATPGWVCDLGYLGMSTRLMRELALPGNEPLTAIRYKDFEAKLKRSVTEQLFGDQPAILGMSQTARLLALRGNFTTPDQKRILVEQIVADLKTGKLTFGKLGAAPFFPVLTYTGHIDTAFDLITTTTGRRWDAKDLVFAGSGLTEWMMSSLAGIDAGSQGFQQVRIAPNIPSGNRLTSVKAHYDSVRGRIAVDWKKLPESFTLTCTVPTGLLAVVTLPVADGQTLTEGGKSIKDAFGAEILPSTKTSHSQEVLIQSGTYSFEVK